MNDPDDDIVQALAQLSRGNLRGPPKSPKAHRQITLYTDEAITHVASMLRWVARRCDVRSSLMMRGWEIYRPQGDLPQHDSPVAA